MLEVFEPEALIYFAFFRPILSTLSVSRIPILTHLSLFGFLDSLLCVLIPPTPSLTFSLVMPRTLAATSSFLSGRAYPSLNFLPPLFLLDPYSDYVGVNITLNNSSSLSFLDVYAPPPIRSSPTDGRTDSFSPSSLSSSRNLFILGDFNCHHFLWDSRGTSDPHGKEVFDWVISSDLLPLNDPDTSTLLHRSSGSCSSPDISFGPPLLPFLAPGRCFRTWVLIIYHFFYLSLSPQSFASTSVSLPSTFKKIAGITLSSTLSLTVFLERNTRLFPFLLLLLFLPLWN